MISFNFFPCSCRLEMVRWPGTVTVRRWPGTVRLRASVDCIAHRWCRPLGVSSSSSQANPFLCQLLNQLHEHANAIVVSPCLPFRCFALTRGQLISREEMLLFALHHSSCVAGQSCHLFLESSYTDIGQACHLPSIISSNELMFKNTLFDLIISLM